jgi:hypothetical protein
VIRYLSLVALALSLTGCDVVRSVFVDPAEKINAAFPLPDALQQSQEQLFAGPQDAALATLRKDYEQRLQARALACSRQAPPGRFDTVGDVRRKLTGSACFHEQDLALLDWVGTQRFMQAMRKPALVPFAPLGANVSIPPQPETTAEVLAARSANVVVLKGANGRLSTIELPSGKNLRSFAAPELSERASSLSPNGRVLAVPVPNALKMMDTETGDTLWSTAKFSEVIAWLPEVEATLFAQNGSAEAALLDQRSGAVVPYPLALPPLTWSVAVSGGKARQVMGNASGVWVVDHSRGADGALQAAIAMQREVPGQGITVLPPLVMDSGRKLVYGSGTDLAWLEIQTGAEGLWNTSAIDGRGFSKNSETTIYLDINQPGANGGARLFDIDKATLARVQGGQGEGALSPLGTRDGWSRRDQAVSLGYGAVAEGAPEPIGKVIVDTQMAKLAPR